MRSAIRAALTLVTIVSALLFAALPANAGDALIGEESACKGPDTRRHSSKLELQAFIGHKVIVTYNWCNMSERAPLLPKIVYAQQPGVTTATTVPGAGLLESVTPDAGSSAVERQGEHTAIWRFTVKQDIAKPSPATQTFTFEVRMKNSVTSLCLGQKCVTSTA